MTPQGDTRDDEDAAEAAHIERMRTAYLRLEALRAERRKLEAEDAAIRLTICEALGVQRGERAENKHGSAVLARWIEGGFMEHPTIDGRVVASVRVSGKVATKTGYHARNTGVVTVVDDTWFDVSPTKEAT